MITKLTVEFFKTLERVEIELGLVNVFVGANGSGKSTCWKRWACYQPQRTAR